MTGARRTSEPVELAPSEAAGSAVGLHALSEPRRGVLEAIKRSGEASADEIAGTVGVTLSAIPSEIGRAHV